MAAAGGTPPPLVQSEYDVAYANFKRAWGEEEKKGALSPEIERLFDIAMAKYHESTLRGESFPNRGKQLLRDWKRLQPS
jgi:hypothetical protein